MHKLKSIRTLKGRTIESVRQRELPDEHGKDLCIKFIDGSMIRFIPIHRHGVQVDLKWEWHGDCD